MFSPDFYGRTLKAVSADRPDFYMTSGDDFSVDTLKFNSDAYRSGDKFPNAGYVRVTVSPASVLVEYVRVFLPQDEVPPSKVSGMVQF